jgi:hypothetical protein
MMKKTVLFCALLTVAAVAVAADNSIGTWKIDAAKSTVGPGVSPFKSLTVVRTASSGGVDVAVKGERADGSKVDSHYVAKYDGKEVPVKGTGLPYDTVSVTQTDADHLTDHRTKKGSKYSATGHFTVAKDGKSAVLDVSGSGADGKPFTSKSVYVRQ